MFMRIVIGRGAVGRFSLSSSFSDGTAASLLGKGGSDCMFPAAPSKIGGIEQCT